MRFFKRITEANSADIKAVGSKAQAFKQAWRTKKAAKGILPRGGASVVESGFASLMAADSMLGAGRKALMGSRQKKQQAQQAVQGKPLQGNIRASVAKSVGLKATAKKMNSWRNFLASKRPPAGPTAPGVKSAPYTGRRNLFIARPPVKGTPEGDRALARVGESNPFIVGRLIEGMVERLRNAEAFKNRINSWRKNELISISKQTKKLARDREAAKAIANQKTIDDAPSVMRLYRRV